jgi:CHASE3 domain sensor protein
MSNQCLDEDESVRKVYQVYKDIKYQLELINLHTDTDKEAKIISATQTVKNRIKELKNNIKKICLYNDDNEVDEFYNNNKEIQDNIESLVPLFKDPEKVTENIIREYIDKKKNITILGIDS